MPNVILAKFLSQKIYSLEPFLSQVCFNKREVYESYTCVIIIDNMLQSSGFFNTFISVAVHIQKKLYLQLYGIVVDQTFVIKHRAPFINTRMLYKVKGKVPWETNRTFRRIWFQTLFQRERDEPKSFEKTPRGNSGKQKKSSTFNRLGPFVCQLSKFFLMLSFRLSKIFEFEEIILVVEYSLQSFSIVYFSAKGDFGGPKPEKLCFFIAQL